MATHTGQGRQERQDLLATTGLQATTGHGTGARATRVLLLATTMTAVVVALAWRGRHVLSQTTPLRVETCLELFALVVGILAAGWLATTSGLALVCVLARATGRSWTRGERLVARHAPAVVRRAARIGVSVSVGAGLVLAGGTAQAAERDLSQPETTVAVDLGWRPSVADLGASTPDDNQPRVALPSPSSGPSTGPSTPGELAVPSLDEPTAHPATGVEPTGTDADGATTGTDPIPTRVRDAVLTVDRSVPPVRPTADEVVVVRGDSLWSIAARTLPEGAPDAEIAASVERWFAANTGVIGGDPDLIRPGQVLTPPVS